MARADGGDPAAERDARLRFQEGLARVQARDFEAARVAFAQAFAVLHKPDILWNLALSEEKSGHLTDALAHFERLDRELPSSADHTGPKKHIDELMGQTGHVDVSAPAGSLVSVDGSPEQECPLRQAWDVMPGHHVVNVRIGGAPARSLEVDAFAGRTVKADFGSGGGGAPVGGAVPSPVPGSVPGATAPQSNGEPGPTPAPPPPAPEATPSGGIPTAKLVTVIAVGGAALLSAGLGIGFGAASTSAANKASDAQKLTPPGPSGCAGSPPGPCADLKSDRSTEKTDHDLSTAMWVTAGVLVAADVGIWFLWPRSPSNGAATAVRVVPSAGPGSAGLTAVGSF
ncbi:MAG: tetratricopeptide repeat protein [Polyangiaceae bacterium]